MTFISGETTRGEFRGAARAFVENTGEVAVARAGIEDAIDRRFNGDFRDAVEEIHAGTFRLEEPSRASTEDLCRQRSGKNGVIGHALAEIMQARLL